MLKREYTSIVWIFAIIQCPVRSSGEQNSLCYIRKGTSQTSLCNPPTPVQCCKGNMFVVNLHVYGDISCGTARKCNDSRHECCKSGTRIHNETYKILLIKSFKMTNCFNDVDIFKLPFNSFLSYVNVSYSCEGRIGDVTNIAPNNSQQTTVTDKTTTTSSPKSDTESSAMHSETGADSETNVAAAVAVPAVIVLIIAAVVAAIFIIRHRRAATKRTDQSGLKLDYRQDPALPPSYDESVNSEYAEIGGNRNSNLVGESNDYSTISPRHLPPVTTGHIPFGQRATNEDYDHIGINSPAKGKGGDTYTHIDHGALTKQHVSNGDVVTDTSTYAHAGHDGQSGYRTNTEYVGWETYAHIDHGALQEHDRKDDPTSTPSVHQGSARSASEESHYDFTGQTAPLGNLGHYQDGGDYSHVGDLPAGGPKEGDSTDGNQN